MYVSKCTIFIHVYTYNSATEVIAQRNLNPCSEADLKSCIETSGYCSQPGFYVSCSVAGKPGETKKPTCFCTDNFSAYPI